MYHISTIYSVINKSTYEEDIYTYNIYYLDGSKINMT